MAMSVTVRLFEPISLLFTENAMPSLRATVSLPPCVLCDGPASPPSRMGWLQTPDRQAGFCVCGGCADCSDSELETKIIAKVSGAPKIDLPPAAADPKAHIGLKAMAAADPAPAKWVTAAAREWVQPAA
jgi:hypothetical protein